MARAIKNNKEIVDRHEFFRSHGCDPGAWGDAEVDDWLDMVERHKGGTDAED